MNKAKEVYNIWQCPRCKEMTFHRVGNIMGTCGVSGIHVVDDFPGGGLTSVPPDCENWKKGKAKFDKGRQDALRQLGDRGVKESG